MLHRIADSFIADLEPAILNGVKIFYGGSPGSMQAEIRVNGERHEAASSAMAALGLPEPTTFTAVRSYALLLPLSAGSGGLSYPGVRLDLTRAPMHTRTDSLGGVCGCGVHLDHEHPGFDLALPHLLAELSEEERRRRVLTDTGPVIIAPGIGNFLKVRLPIRLDDGRTVIYLAWVYLEAAVIDDFVHRVHNDELADHRFRGLLCNAIGPWGQGLLRAPVVLGGQRTNEDGSVALSEILESSDPLLRKVLTDTWPAALVLDPASLPRRQAD